jgi:hypothetical protein
MVTPPCCPSPEGARREQDRGKCENAIVKNLIKWMRSISPQCWETQDTAKRLIRPTLGIWGPRPVCAWTRSVPSKGLCAWMASVLSPPWKNPQWHVGPSPSSLALSASQRAALLLHTLSCVASRFDPGLKAAKLTVDLGTHEPPPLSCFSQVFCHSDKQLIHTDSINLRSKYVGKTVRLCKTRTDIFPLHWFLNNAA